MRWGHNLKKLADGQWRVTFRGKELKVGRRGFKANVYERTYSRELSQTIDEWYAMLQGPFGANVEERMPFVFPAFVNHGEGRDDQPLLHAAFARHVSDLCVELRGERFNLHKVRHIVASYIVNELGAGGIGLAAELLGDTPQVIIASYYRPNTEEAFTAYLAKRLP